jgi:predicted transcriptional regulator
MPKPLQSEDDYPTSIRIPPDIKRLLDKHAREQKRPRTYIILEILQQWLAFYTKQKKDKALREQLPK